MLGFKLIHVRKKGTSISTNKHIFNTLPDLMLRFTAGFIKHTYKKFT